MGVKEKGVTRKNQLYLEHKRKQYEYGDLEERGVKMKEK